MVARCMVAAMSRRLDAIREIFHRYHTYLLSHISTLGLLTTPTSSQGIKWICNHWISYLPHPGFPSLISLRCTDAFRSDNSSLAHFQSIRLSARYSVPPSFPLALIGSPPPPPPPSASVTLSLVTRSLNIISLVPPSLLLTSCVYSPP